MSNNKSKLGREISYLFLAPFLVLIGVLGYGVLFDRWYKDPLMILKYSAIAYGVILTLRFFGWAIRSLSK